MAGVNSVQVISPITQTESQKLQNLLPDIKHIQVVHIESPEELELIDRHSSYVNAFLLDSGKPSLAIPEYGGTGRTHDWSISAEFVRRSNRPVYLAGGLNCANVKEAIHQVKPFGVDVCSGVRANNALDLEKLKSFIKAVRETERDR